MPQSIHTCAFSSSKLCRALDTFDIKSKNDDLVLPEMSDVDRVSSVVCASTDTPPTVPNYSPEHILFSTNTLNEVSFLDDLLEAEKYSNAAIGGGVASEEPSPGTCHRSHVLLSSNSDRSRTLLDIPDHWIESDNSDSVESSWDSASVDSVDSPLSHDQKDTLVPMIDNSDFDNNNRRRRVGEHPSNVQQTHRVRRRQKTTLLAISDDELARMSMPELLRYGRKEGASDGSIQELKLRRRKLKNRCSARGSAQKRRKQFRSLTAANTRLETEYKLLQKRSKDLLHTYDEWVSEARILRCQATSEAAKVRNLSRMVERLRETLHSAEGIDSTSLMSASG
eukprot:m.1638961 g.1638961  ORF g.1638961 m.1638961 type:complete len:338 (-) comp32143_c0_seq1:353-1366(-)